MRSTERSTVFREPDELAAAWKGSVLMDLTNERAVRAKTDPGELESFIADNQKYILSCAGHTVNRFVTVEDDEFIIGMEAFHEAVNSYDESKGSFKTFSSVVIQRRITDYLRSEMRHKHEISVEPMAFSGDTRGEDETALQTEVREKTEELSVTAGAPGDNDILYEIEAVQEVLNAYGFSFYDLTECSPKSEKTKAQCAAAIASVVKDPDIVSKMKLKKVLPIKEVSRASGVKTKVLDRHRRYIIASAEILTGDYPQLAEYLREIRKAVS